MDDSGSHHSRPRASSNRSSDREHLIDSESVHGYGSIDESESIARPLRSEELKIGSTRTFINVVKGMIGPGCLSLPMAFKYCGVWTGFVFTFLVGMMNTHCMCILVHCATYLCDRTGRDTLDYGHMAKKAVDFGPERFRRHSKRALYFTNISLCLYQVCVGSVQFVFMGSNLQSVISFLENDRVQLSKQTYIAIWLIPVLLACYIRQLRFIAICSMAGNVLMVAGFTVIFYNIFSPPNHYYELHKVPESFTNFLLFLGSIMYAFEGQAMVLPLENRMKRSQDLARPFGVLHASMTIVTAIYVATGLLGFIKYGNGVHGSITLDMPHTTLYQVVNLVMVFAVFSGLPMQNYVIVEILYPSILRKLPATYHPWVGPLEYAFRTAIVLVEFTFAMVVPKLDSIIPLVGVVAGIGISLVLPPLLEILTFYSLWESERSKTARYLLVTKNLALVLLGIFGIVGGLYATIDSLIKDPPF